MKSQRSGRCFEQEVYANTLRVEVPFVIIRRWYRSGRIDRRTGDVEPSARSTKEK